MKYDTVLHVNFDSPEALKLGFLQAAAYKDEAIRHKHGLTAQEIAARAGFVSLEDIDVCDVVMVVDGPAVQKLAMTHGDLLQAAQEAVEGRLRIAVDAVSLEYYGVSREELWPFVEVVPSSILELIRLQHEGYAYIKV